MIACHAAILAGVYVFTNIAESKQATTVRKRMETGSDLWHTPVADMPCSTTRSDSHATIYGPQPIDGSLPRFKVAKIICVNLWPSKNSETDI